MMELHLSAREWQLQSSPELNERLWVYAGEVGWAGGIRGKSWGTVIAAYS